MPETTRSDSNYRVYSDAHVQQLSLIRYCRGMDMSLDEIRTLLRFANDPTQDCGPIDALLDTHLAHVSQRIRELRALEKQLKALRQSCSGSQDAQHCGILCHLTEDAAKPPKTRARGHVRTTHL